MATIQQIIELLLQADTSGATQASEALSQVQASAQASSGAVSASMATAQTGARAAAEDYTNLASRMREAGASSEEVSGVLRQSGVAASELGGILKTAGFTELEPDVKRAGLTLQQFRTELQAGSGALSGFGVESGGLRQVLSGLDAAGLSTTAGFAALGVAVGAALTLVVAKAGELQQAEADLQATGNLTASQAGAIGNAFIEQGVALTKTASEEVQALSTVAPILEQISGSALTVGQSVGFMTAATDLAEASHTKLEASATSLATVMRTYGLSLDQAGQAAGTLLAVTELTGVGVEQFSQVAGRLHDRFGPLAPDLDHTATLMTQFSAAGVTGSRGIMVLSSGIDHLLGQGPGVEQEMGALGLSLTDNAGRMKSWSDLFPEIVSALSGLSDAQRLQAEQALFGTTAGVAWDDVIKKGALGADEAAIAVGEHSDAVQQAAIVTSTMSGETGRLVAGLSNLAALAGGGIVDTFTGMADQAQQVSHALADLRQRGDDVQAGLAEVSPAGSAAAVAIIAVGQAVVGLKDHLLDAVPMLRLLVDTLGYFPEKGAGIISLTDRLLALTDATKVENTVADQLKRQQDAASGALAATGIAVESLSARVAAGATLTGTSLVNYQKFLEANTKSETDAAQGKTALAAAEAGLAAAYDTDNKSKIAAAEAALQLATAQAGLSDATQSNADKIVSLQGQMADAIAGGRLHTAAALQEEIAGYGSADEAGRRHLAQLVEDAARADQADARSAATAKSAADLRQQARDADIKGEHDVAQAYRDEAAAVEAGEKPAADAAANRARELTTEAAVAKQAAAAAIEARRSVTEASQTAAHDAETLGEAEIDKGREVTQAEIDEDGRRVDSTRSAAEQQLAIVQSLAAQMAAAASDPARIKDLREQFQTAQQLYGQEAQAFTKATSDKQAALTSFHTEERAELAASLTVVRDERQARTDATTAYKDDVASLPAAWRSALEAQAADVQRYDAAIRALDQQLTADMRSEDRKRLEEKRSDLEAGRQAAVENEAELHELAARPDPRAQGLTIQLDAENELKARIDLSRQADESLLSVLTKQSAVLSDQNSLLSDAVKLSQDKLAAAGDTSGTDAYLAHLKVLKDQLEQGISVGAATPPGGTAGIDALISKEQARLQLIQDQNAEANVGNQRAIAQGNVAQDELGQRTGLVKVALDQAAAQEAVTTNVAGTIQRLTEEQALQTAINKLIDDEAAKVRAIQPPHLSGAPGGPNTVTVPGTPTPQQAGAAGQDAGRQWAAGAATGITQNTIAVTNAVDAGPLGKTGGQAIGEGIAGGITETTPAIEQAARGAVEAAMAAARDEAEASSPSRRSAREIGLPLSQGVAVGIGQGAAAIASAMGGAVGAAFSGSALGSAGPLVSLGAQGPSPFASALSPAAAGGAAPQAAQGPSPAGPMFAGHMFHVEHLTVRSDADIERLGQQIAQVNTAAVRKREAAMGFPGG